MDIKIGGIYRHYKGNVYRVLNIGINTETEEEMVVYSPIDGENKFWIRPLSMWNDIINKEKKYKEI